MCVLATKNTTNGRIKSTADSLFYENVFESGGDIPAKLRRLGKMFNRDNPSFIKGYFMLPIHQPMHWLQVASCFKEIVV